MKVEQRGQPKSDLPSGLAAPARRALAGAGIAGLEQLTEISEAEIKALHGVGPNAIAQLRGALDAIGLAFADKTRNKGKANG